MREREKERERLIPLFTVKGQGMDGLNPLVAQFSDIIFAC